MAVDFGQFGFLSDGELVSFAIFALCFLITTITSSRTFKRGHTARAIRSEYRKSWAWAMVDGGEMKVPVDVFRNNLTISTALLGGLVIAFGLVANAFITAQSVSLSLYLAFIISVMTYALFYLLIEIRTLAYLPIMFGVDSKLIERNEKMKKEEYISRLMDNTYDDFSNAVRALFYLIALLTFSLNSFLFIAATLAITYLFVRRDLSGKSRIEIF